MSISVLPIQKAVKDMDSSTALYNQLKDLIAATHELEAYASFLSQYKGSRKRVGGLKLEELPGLESLQVPGGWKDFNCVARAVLENPPDKTKVHLIYANVTYDDILLKASALSQLTDLILTDRPSTDAGEMAYNSVLLILFSTLLTLTVAGRMITTTSSSDMVSDGVHDEHRGILRLNPFVSAEETESCRRSYGFMPCTTSIFGNLILLLIYNYVMSFAVSFLTSGSELLLHSLGTGVVGGVLVPIFGAAPQAIIILASGVFGSIKVAQDQVYIGMGLLAGSTVFLITVIWGDCLLTGKCDIVNSVAVDNQDTKPFDMIGSGVSTDIWTSYAAMIMTVSVVPLIVLQLPYIIPSTFGRNLSVLIGLVLSVSLLVAYCVYQVIQPKWQKRRLAFTKHKHVRARILMELSSRSVGGLLDVQDGPNLAVMSKLFDSIDVNGNKRLSQSELRALVVGLQLNDIKMNEDDAIDEVMKEFDTSNNNEIEFEEFAAGLQKWLQKAKDSKRGLYTPGTETMEYVHDYFEETLKEHYLVGDDDDVEEGEAEIRLSYLFRVIWDSNHA
ncbi:hypothetical protein L2E82_25769 [Cichorium intybus]|uniref:Uncharacterized protein n=1 Tax=Cichorium intybus TaxID=13427 RepID=A0ACB9E555_CICIN|nr:hypothetical protein L2E82_25769 [Cichorium intybus]